jgi:hypothetical protein
MKLQKYSRRQIMGLILIAISTIAWTGVFFVPFLPLENILKVSTIAGLIIIGEVTGYPGLALLGKDAITVINDKFDRLKLFFTMKSDRGQ